MVRSVLRHTCSETTDVVFFFNDTATTEIYTLSLHDALPICSVAMMRRSGNDHDGSTVVEDILESITTVPNSVKQIGRAHV